MKKWNKDIILLLFNLITIDKLKGIFGLILIFGVINLVLWGGQELYYYKDTQEINKIENILDQKKSEINRIELSIDNLSTTINSKQLELNR